MNPNPTKAACLATLAAADAQQVQETEEAWAHLESLMAESPIASTISVLASTPSATPNPFYELWEKSARTSPPASRPAATSATCPGCDPAMFMIW